LVRLTSIVWTKTLKHLSKHLLLCSTKESHTWLWGWGNQNFHFFGWTIFLRSVSLVYNLWFSMSVYLCIYYVYCWCTAISIVALSTTVLPTSALISTCLFAKTSFTSLLQWQTSPLRQSRGAPTLQIWKCSDISVSWISSSRGVGAALGVPAALPHAGDPPGFTGDEVVNPSKTFRNFFIFIFVYTTPFLLKTHKTCRRDA